MAEEKIEKKGKPVNWRMLGLMSLAIVGAYVAVQYGAVERLRAAYDGFRGDGQPAIGSLPVDKWIVNTSSGKPASEIRPAVIKPAPKTQPGIFDVNPSADAPAEGSIQITAPQDQTILNGQIQRPQQIQRQQIDFIIKDGKGYRVMREAW